MSARISAINPAVTEGHLKDTLNTIKAKFGMIPNTLKTMAHSPAVLDGYLALGASLSKGVLPAKTREQIALAVSE